MGNCNLCSVDQYDRVRCQESVMEDRRAKHIQANDLWSTRRCWKDRAKQAAAFAIDKDRHTVADQDSVVGQFSPTADRHHMTIVFLRKLSNLPYGDSGSIDTLAELALLVSPSTVVSLTAEHFDHRLTPPCCRCVMCTEFARSSRSLQFRCVLRHRPTSAGITIITKCTKHSCASLPVCCPTVHSFLTK